MERKHFLDNIRWVTVVVVLIYHVFYLYNSAGVLGGVGAFQDVQYQDVFMYVVYPWFMALLFVVAGCSARYALTSSTYKEFLKKRTVKLLVPSALGLFAFQWIVGYMNIKIGGGLEMIPKFILYPICVISGIGPLWFAQTLWLFSLLLILILKLDKKGKILELGKKTKTWMILLLWIPLWGAAQILNMPILTMYRFGIYFVAFLLGYFVMSHEEVQERIEQIRIPTLICSIIGAILYTIYYFGENFADNKCLQSIWTNLYLWIVILAVFGCFKTWFNKTNRFAGYMSKSSFGIDVVHYVVVLYSCYFLKNCVVLPVWLIYVLAIAITLFFSVVLYEIIRRIPVLRYWVLGIKKDL